MFGMLWIMWLVFMFAFLIVPIGYGWGYRGWGLPYPRYIQRRRALRGSAAGPTTFDHHAWGRGGDWMWIFFVIAVFWAFSTVVWR